MENDTDKLTNPSPPDLPDLTPREPAPKRPSEKMKRIQRSIADGDVCLYCGEPADLVCDECDRKAQASSAAADEAKRRRKIAERREKFRESFREYADTDRDKLPRTAALTAATSFIVGGTKGLLITGPGRTGKTRSATWICRRELEEGRTVDFIAAPDLRASFGHVRDFERVPRWRTLIGVDVLVIDDFGNHTFTRAAEEGFLNLIEARINRKKRTIVTSQYNSAQLAALLTTDQMADALLRRIGGEFNAIADTTEDTWKP